MPSDRRWGIIVEAIIQRDIMNRIQQRLKEARLSSEIKFREIRDERLHPFAQIMTNCDIDDGYFVTRSGRKFPMTKHMSRLILFLLQKMKPEKRQKVVLSMYEDTPTAFEVLQIFYDYTPTQIQQDDSLRG